METVQAGVAFTRTIGPGLDANAVLTDLRLVVMLDGVILYQKAEGAEAAVAEITPTLAYKAGSSNMYDLTFAFPDGSDGSGYWECQSMVAGISLTFEVLQVTVSAEDGMEPPSPVTGTFDPSLATPKDHIRLILGDTDEAHPLLADETIEGMLSAHPYGEALAQLAESLIAEYGQRPSEYGESGGVRLTWGDRVSAWRRIADDARAGKIQPPTSTRPARSGMAIQETAIQAQTPRTRRTDSRTPTLMEGFRTD